jgi:hypothetical protein
MAHDPHGRGHGQEALPSHISTSEATEGLYFFPENRVTEAELRALLASGTRQQRCWVISHLLRFAQWDDIWIYVSRDEVREVFGEVELPENLRSAWGRMLKIEAPVG